MKTKDYAVKYTLHASTNNDFKKVTISNSADAASYAKAFYFDDINIFESCFILLLNRANKTTGYAKISQGGIVSTVVDVKIIAKYAVDAMASGVILIHNHPSGTLTPSASDIQISGQLKKALKILEIELLDSIILTDSGYYSLLDNGKL